MIIKVHKPLYEQFVRLSAAFIELFHSVQSKVLWFKVNPFTSYSVQELLTFLEARYN